MILQANLASNSKTGGHKTLILTYALLFDEFDRTGSRTISL
jgi:hypothetical protein